MLGLAEAYGRKGIVAGGPVSVVTRVSVGELDFWGSGNVAIGADQGPIPDEGSAVFVEYWVEG